MHNQDTFDEISETEEVPVIIPAMVDNEHEPKVRSL